MFRLFRTGLIFLVSAVLAVIVFAALDLSASRSGIARTRHSLARLESARELKRLHVYRMVVSGKGDFRVNEDGEAAYFIGKDSTTFVALATVDAYLDMDAISISYDEGPLVIHAPPIELEPPNIHSDKSFLWKTSAAVRMEDMHRLIMPELTRKAMRQGIMELSRKSAEDFLRGLFSNLGYPEVIVRFEG